MAAKRASKRKPSAQASRKAAAIASLPGVVVRGRIGPRYAEILSHDALAFLAELHRRFDAHSAATCSRARAERQKRFDAGELPDFLPETRHIRDGDWKVAPIPADLHGPPRRDHRAGRPQDDRQCAQFRRQRIHGRFRGRQLADLGQHDRGPDQPERPLGQARSTSPIRTPAKRYELGPKPAVLIVRPRGWHLAEAHLDGRRRADVRRAVRFRPLFLPQRQGARWPRGSGPYFYLPKLESHHEARLWNDVFLFAQERSAFRTARIKATVLIETLPAAFEMDEILWEMRDHIAGLNAGRWDYIFSFIKTLAKNPDYVLPDRSQVVMGEAFLGAYALAAGARPATGAAPSRWAAWRRKSRSRTTAQANDGRLRQGARRQGARGRATAMTAPGSRIPIWCRSPRKCSTA